MVLWHWKGRVRIRKSKSGEKWNEQFVNDAYGVFIIQVLYFKIMFMPMSDSALRVCNSTEIDAFQRL